jgi:integrase
MDGFDELTEATLNKIIGFGIKSETVIRQFRQSCKRLGEYLSKRRCPFSKEAGLQWLSEVFEDEGGGLGLAYARNTRKRRAVLLLAECQKGLLDEWKIYPRRQAKAPIGDRFLALVDAHKQHLVAEGKADSTIAFALRVARDFLIFLEDEGGASVDDITAESIAGYFCQQKFSKRTPTGVQAFACRLRIFIRFLEEFDHLVNGSLYLAVPHSFATTQSIVSVVADDIVEKLLGSKKLDKGIGIRDRAMILLALRLGLRRSDILGLRLGDISWSAERISIIQRKTDVPVVLPLLPDVGNALADYILNERPSSDDDAVFLRNCAPHQHLKTTSSGITKKHLPTDTTIAQGGTHILRRTFATRLLAGGVPMSVISASLGQTNPNSSGVYLANDEVPMRTCALGLVGIECKRKELQ